MNASSNVALAPIPSYTKKPFKNPLRSRPGQPLETAPLQKYKRPGLFKRMASHAYGYFKRAHDEMYGEVVTDSYPASNNTNLDSISGGTVFTVIPCDGGVLITTKYVDNNSFDVKTKCYVIPNGEKLGERIDTIFGFEVVGR